MGTMPGKCRVGWMTFFAVDLRSQECERDDRDAVSTVGMQPVVDDEAIDWSAADLSNFWTRM